MKTKDLKAKLYRKAANKAVKMQTSKTDFWQRFKKVIDDMIYECSYRTAFDPTIKNINERTVLCELQTLAVNMTK